MNKAPVLYLAENALGGFKTLDIETAADLAQSDLRDIIKEAKAPSLGITDDAMLIPLIKPIE